MKAVSLQLVLQTAFLVVVFSDTDRAQSADVPGHSKQDLQAKTGYCHDCHGSSGQGYRGAFPIPRLAGQTTVYIEDQLRAFAEGRRGANIASILSKTHELSPAMRATLAAHFAALNPRPIGGAPKHLVDAGKKIYEEGVPDAGVPACSLCHGQNAIGNDANARLAGQLYSYTVKQLVNWSKERVQKPSGDDTSSAMASIAQGMTRPQIEAVAAYLSDLK